MAVMIIKRLSNININKKFKVKISIKLLNKIHNKNTIKYKTIYKKYKIIKSNLISNNKDFNLNLIKNIKTNIIHKIKDLLMKKLIIFV
jgi:hypothetical protein